MAATKISALASKSFSSPLDLVPIVDVSDTSMAASGTDKQITVGNLRGVRFTQSSDGATVSNTITETSIVGTGTGSLTLPANFFVVGKQVRVRSSGLWAGAGSSGNVSLKMKIGSLSVSTSALVVSAHGNTLFETDWVVLCKSTGVSGSFVLQGHCHWYTSAVGMTPCSVFTTGTLDTTGTLAIDQLVTWTAANAGNTITQNTMDVVAIN